MEVDGKRRAGEAAVMDVTERDFDRQVIERSRTVPVVVDFWAPWCGPCLMLGPTLERLAEEAGGTWRLAKVNTDDDPGLAMEYGVQGIPAVKAFRDGKVVDEFVGAQPEPAVRAFLQRILPSEADGIAGRGRKLELQGDVQAAVAAYERAIGMQPDHPVACLGLGRIRLSQDRIDEAVASLSRVAPGTPQRGEAEALLARARFRREAGLTGTEVEVRRRIAAHPDDLEARLALAALAADKGQYREALEVLLTVLEKDTGEARERARSAMLAIFQLLGDGHELTRAYRPRLAATLF